MVYAAAQVLPGNPGRLVLGREATPEAVATFNQKLGFDRPLPVRYLDWLESALCVATSGRTTATGVPVTDDLVPALKRSAFLALYAFVLCVPISIVAGVIAAVQARETDRPADHGRGALARRDPRVRARRDPRRDLRAGVPRLVPRYRRAP